MLDNVVYFHPHQVAVQESIGMLKRERERDPEALVNV